MFRRRKKVQPLVFDRAAQKPVIRASICTGEQVGGLRDLRTGRFTDIMLIRTPDDLRAFQELVGTSDIEKEY